MVEEVEPEPTEEVTEPKPKLVQVEEMQEVVEVIESPLTTAESEVAVEETKVEKK